MANFCSQCSIELFGADMKDLAGLTKPKHMLQGKYARGLCEDCGDIQVNAKGECLSHCEKDHARHFVRMGES